MTKNNLSCILEPLIVSYTPIPYPLYKAAVNLSGKTLKTNQICHPRHRNVKNNDLVHINTEG